LKINEEGEYFPILGISLGSELMLATIANDFQILNEFNSTNHSTNLKFLKVLIIYNHNIFNIIYYLLGILHE